MNERYPLPAQNSRKMIYDSRALWKEIFSEDSDAFLDYYKENVAGTNRIQTRYEEGSLVSMVHWNPYTLYINDRTVKSYYMVGVATKERWRHRGFMKGLISDGMFALAAEKVPFVFLMPADPAIYTPLDFRYIYGKSEWEGSLADAGNADALTVSTMSVRTLNAWEMEDAAAFANRILRKKFSVYAKRSGEYYARIQKECESEGGTLAGIFMKDRLIGVFSWWPDEINIIREMILAAEYEDRRDIIFPALLRYFEGAERCRMVTTGWLGEKKPIIMGRIVNLPRFLAGFTADERVTLRIWVKDEIIPDNNGSFCWILSPEGSLVYPTEKEPDGAVSIDELMTWLTGASGVPEMLPEEARKVHTLSGVFLPEIV